MSVASRLSRPLAALLGASLLGGTALAHDHDVTLIHAGTLLAVPGTAPKAKQTVVVRAGKVAEIRDGFATPADVGTPTAKVVDLADSFVLPGLIDMHVHLSFNGVVGSSPLDGATLSEGDVSVNATINADKTLQAGFTTVRDLGAPGRSVFAVKRAIDQGRIPGPTVYAAGEGISATAGHMDVNGFNDRVLAALQGYSTCDGPDDCRRAVREQVKRGATVIKLATTGGVLSQIGAGTGKQLFEDEARAIVETAHLFGLKVAAHAHAAEGVDLALKVGVDTIDHGSFQTPETHKLFQQTGAWYVPTLLAGVTVVEQAQKAGGALSEFQRAKALAVGSQMQNTFRAAWQAGVKVAYGTDTGVSAHGENAREFKLMVDQGMPAAEVVKSATVNAAAALGASDTIGTLEPGKQADIVAVTGNPLEDVTVLERMEFVMRKGTVHRLDGVKQIAR